MTTTITVSASHLARVADLLHAAFRGDVLAGGAHKRMGMPVTLWPTGGGLVSVTIAAAVTDGVASLSIPATIEGDVLDEFTFSLAAIRDAKASLGKGDVQLTIDGDRMTVQAAGASLLLVSPGPRPRFVGQTDPARQASFSLDVAALPWVANAAGGDDVRPAMTRVNVAPGENGSESLLIQAADGFRLHEARVGAAVSRWDGADSVSLPAWLVAVVGKIAPRSIGVWSGWWDDGRHQAAAHCWDGDLAFQASWSIVGLYPDLHKVTSAIPDDAPVVAGKMADLADALTGVKPVAKYSANIFRVSAGVGGLTLEAQAVETGTVRRVVAATGDVFPFAADVRYWLQALGKPKNGAEFAISMDPRNRKPEGQSAPIRLVTQQPFGLASAIIMPMHIAR